MARTALRQLNINLIKLTFRAEPLYVSKLGLLEHFLFMKLETTLTYILVGANAAGHHASLVFDMETVNALGSDSNLGLSAGVASVAKELLLLVLFKRLKNFLR